MYRSILAPLDGSPSAEQILEPAGELAKLLGAACRLLRVVPAVAPPNEPAKQYGWTYERVEQEGAPPSELPAPTAAALADKMRAEAHVYLRRMAASLRERGIPAGERIIAHAHPATAILNEAASGEYDVLALETHGRHGLPRLFLGSVADKVVRTVETINETAQERNRNLFQHAAQEQPWRNRLIWGDKKYMLPSLLPEFGGKVNLIYIDPPFDTGADFSFTATVPEHEDDGGGGREAESSLDRLRSGALRHPHHAQASAEHSRHAAVRRAEPWQIRTATVADRPVRGLSGG
jgi:nucleotide-binding universal stress UspA family protein